MKRKGHGAGVSSRLLFGTDGIRGVVNRGAMTAETAMSLGRALTHLMREDLGLSRKPKVVIGKDTRLSGDMLLSAAAAGVMSQGGDAFLADTLPTPGLANLTASTRADAGMVISASHNPFEDNGLKIFDGQGWKLPDETEARLERLMEDPATLDAARPQAGAVGRAYPVRDAVGRYVVSLKSAFPKRLTLEGITIVLDCADGAAYRSAPAVFEELGANVHVLSAAPDGFNINRGSGALHPEVCAAEVLRTGADLGVALDGDADRAIFIDAGGQVVDGDQIMFLCASHMKSKGTLANDAVCATVMSTMALDAALARVGVKLYRAQVGDRYVAECLRRESLNFGGEKSGHLIFVEHATTGDGTLAALQTLAVMKESGLPLKELAAQVAPLPQILLNVRVAHPAAVGDNPAVARMLDDCRGRLGSRGRVLLRPSGTEPVVRVMVEGEDLAEITALAKECADLVEREMARGEKPRATAL
ncbi:MAG: phosphoglucosamine mutase [Deltaproteobacteria bacterium]|jgi:phosphoglucosamine mutase|nr:phosphoglucosamine mutase [Deltaproteobacteria bacterium]